MPIIIKLQWLLCHKSLNIIYKTGKIRGLPFSALEGLCINVQENKEEIIRKITLVGPN